MDKKQLDHLITLIHKRLTALKAANETDQESREIVTLDQQSVGRLSRMDAMQQQAMAQANQRRRAIETKQLELALKRIADDDYGYCEDCGEDIALKRLELTPTAQRCITCANA